MVLVLALSSWVVFGARFPTWVDLSTSSSIFTTTGGGLCLSVTLMTPGLPAAWRERESTAGFIGCPAMPLPIVGLGWQSTDGEYPEKTKIERAGPLARLMTPVVVLTELRGLSLPAPQWSALAYYNAMTSNMDTFLKFQNAVSGSPWGAPFKCRACPLSEWLSHRGNAVRLHLLATLWPSGGATRVGERRGCSRAICMSAFELGRLTVRAAVDWHVALEGRLGQWWASGLAWAVELSGSEVGCDPGLAMVVWESPVQPRPCRD